MPKLNKQRQAQLLAGEIGVINDGKVEQLREVLNDQEYVGGRLYYTKDGPTNEQIHSIKYHSISYFYTDDPTKVRIDKWSDVAATWYKNKIGQVVDVEDYSHIAYEANGYQLILKSDYTIIDTELPKVERTPSHWILNVDLPNMGYEKGDRYFVGGVELIHSDLLPYVATPIYPTTYPFTLSDGTKINLTVADIDGIANIKK